MKKQLFYMTLIFAILWNPLASASRSRLTALGQNPNGSLYIKDVRNMFLNPAQINSVQNQVNLEWGDKDSNVTPKAEGGLVHETGSMKLGLQLGRVGEAASDAVFGAGASQANLTIGDYPQDSVELLFGSEGSMLWGGAFHYVNNEAKNSQTDSATEAKIMTGKFGVILGKIQGYLHADIANSLKNETSGVTKEYDGQLTLRLGGSYDISGDSQLGIEIDRHAYDTNNGTTSVKGEGEDLKAQLNWFRTLKQTEGHFLYYSFGLSYRDQELKFSPGGLSMSIEKLALPIALGLETKAKEWLVFRGSIAQEVIINKDETKDTAGNTTENINADDTVVAAGVGFIWSESLTMDATFSGAGSAGSGQFNANTMFAEVGMNYSF